MYVNFISSASIVQIIKQAFVEPLIKKKIVIILWHVRRQLDKRSFCWSDLDLIITQVKHIYIT